MTRDEKPMVSCELAWDIVQHQVGGPGSSDRACIDDKLRREIMSRARAGMFDIAYREQYHGKLGRLVLYRPATAQEQGMVEERFRGVLVSDLNLIEDEEGLQLAERVAGELARDGHEHPMSGDWGRLDTAQPGLVVEIGPRVKLDTFGPRP